MVVKVKTQSVTEAKIGWECARDHVAKDQPPLRDALVQLFTLTAFRPLSSFLINIPLAHYFSYRST